LKYTHVIWDFNGTILDDLRVGFETVNYLLEKRGLRQIASIDEYKRIFGFPIIDYYVKLGFDFEKESYDDIAVEWSEEYLARCKDAVLQSGVARLLSELQANGIKQIVLTASETEMVTGQLKELGVRGYFDEILGLDNLRAYSKTMIGKRWMELNKPKGAVLIGDTLHDHDTAVEMGIDCILVACGHQNTERLLRTGRRVAADMNEVYELLFK